MKQYLLSIAILAASATTLVAQHQDILCYYDDPGRHERNRNAEVQHMKLEVSFEPAKGKVIGRVTHTLRCLQDNVDTIFLDGPGISVKSAVLDGKPVTVDTNALGVIIRCGLKGAYNSIHTLQIDYSATPTKGIYFIGWKLPEIKDPAHQSRRQIWTQGQGTDNRYWIPMIDDRGDKYVTEVIVQFEKDYKVLSNGDLLENKENKDNTRTWHYKINHQHAGYLLMLAIDKYAVKSTKTKSGVPIHFWYYPEHPERVHPTSMYSEQIIEFLENEIGVKYQWGSYSQVMIQDFLYGAMENTSATTFGDFFWVDNRSFLDRNYIGVNAHEATHQWFGDLITARNDGDHWLQESFATFYPGLFTATVYGADETPWYFRGNMNAAIAAGEKNSLPVRNSEAGSPRHYPKGASVIYMLQHVMGRDNFRRGVQLYLNRHGFSGVETRDFELAMLDASGMNMDWFFDEWIYRGGEPAYDVSYQPVPTGTEFTVKQVHKMEQTVGAFKMPVDFAVYYTDGSSDKKTVMVDQVFQKVVIPNPSHKTIDFALFDEGSYVLKKVNFPKPFKELRSQFLKAPNMLDRYDALLAMAGTPMAEKRETLLQSLGTERYRNLRAEIVKQLAADPTGNAAILEQAYQERDIEVRRAVISNTAISAGNVSMFEKALTDSSYFIIESALLKLWEFTPMSSRRAEWLSQIKDLDGYIMNLKVRYLELGCDAEPAKRGANIAALTAYTDSTYEFRTRINAMQALQRLNACTPSVVHNLCDAMLSFNTRLAGPAKDVLSYFKQQTAFMRTIRSEVEQGSYTAAQRKKLMADLNL